MSLTLGNAWQDILEPGGTGGSASLSGGAFTHPCFIFFFFLSPGTSCKVTPTPRGSPEIFDTYFCAGCTQRCGELIVVENELGAVFNCFNVFSRVCFEGFFLFGFLMFFGCFLFVF